MKDNYSPPPAELGPGSLVWVYCRDSGGPNQTESVRQQETAIRAYCEKHKLVIDRRGVFRDVARSGGSVVKRDEFLAMIEKSQDEANRPRAVLCYDISRFARNYAEFNHYESILNMRGILVHYLDENIPEDFFAGQVVKAVKALGAEEFRRDLSRKVKRGLKDLVSMGKGYAPGTPPRGYKAEPVEIGIRRDGKPRIVSRWTPDEELAEYVKMAFEMRAQGRSYQEIINATHGKLYSGKNSWSTFFRNKSYLGYYGETPDHHEPLITQEVFDAVQAQMRRWTVTGGAKHPRRVSSPALFSGIAYCAHCGAMMVIGKSRRSNPWDFYLCGSKSRKGNATCPSRRIAAKKAEAQVLAVVTERVLTPGFLLEVTNEVKRRFSSIADMERQISLTRRTLEELDVGIQRVLRAIEKTGSPSAHELLLEREAERRRVKAELDNLNAQLAVSQIEITPDAMEGILSVWREELSRARESGNVREVKAWLMRFVSRIDLDYNRATIYFTYPMKDLFDAVSARPCVEAQRSLA